MKMSAKNGSIEVKDGPSNFEKFIKSKLNQVPTSSTGNFVLPKLLFSAKKTSTATEVNKTIEQNKIEIVPVETDNLKLNELHISDINDNVNSIDLTEALNFTNKHLQSQILHDSKNISEEIFDVPFLDGDLDTIINDSTSLLMQSPFTCIKKNINIANFHLKHNAKCNSKIGKIFKLNYYCTRNIFVDHSFKSKPLKSFDFSTKSPDDKLLEIFHRKTCS